MVLSIANEYNNYSPILKLWIIKQYKSVKLITNCEMIQIKIFWVKHKIKMKDVHLERNFELIFVTYLNYLITKTKCLHR